MDSPGLIVGKLNICDSKGQRWCETYKLATVDVVEAKRDFLALCRYRAACLASEFSLVRGHLEFVNDHRPSILLIEKPLPSPWSGKVRPLLSTLNIAIECRFETSEGKSISTSIHGVGRSGPRTGFLTSVQAVFEPDAVPCHQTLTSPEEGFRAFVSFLRDKTIYSRMNKSGKVMGTAPWKSVTVNDIDLEAEVEFVIDEKENTDMLPSLSSMYVKGFQKSIKVVQVGPLRLYFELSRKHEKMPSRIVGFQVDGQPPIVCQRAGDRVMTDKYLAYIESDKSKWLPENEFVSKWLETSKSLMITPGTPT